MKRRSGGFQIQVVLLALLPVSIVLALVSFGAVAIHQNTLRDAIAQSDYRTTLSTVNALSRELRACRRHINESGAGSPLDADAVQACIPRSFLNSLVNPAAERAPVTAVIFDDSGAILVQAGPPTQFTNLTTDTSAQAALAGLSGSLFQLGGFGTEELEYVVSYASLDTSSETYHLGIRVQEPWRAIANPLLQYSMVVPLVLLPLSLLSALLLWLGWRRVVHPLQKLQTRITALQHGDFSVRSGDLPHHANQRAGPGHHRGVPCSRHHSPRHHSGCRLCLSGRRRFSVENRAKQCRGGSHVSRHAQTRGA